MTEFREEVEERDHLNSTEFAGDLQWQKISIVNKEDCLNSSLLAAKSKLYKVLNYIIFEIEIQHQNLIIKLNLNSIWRTLIYWWFVE